MMRGCFCIKYEVQVLEHLAISAAGLKAGGRKEGERERRNDIRSS
jgi:hypothetical protein